MAPPPESPDQKASMKSSLASYVSARAELFAIEAKEASTVATEKVKYSVKGSILFLIGYVLLLTTVIGVGGALLDMHLTEPLDAVGGWPFIALFLAIIHLILGALSLKKASKTPTDGLFSYTKAELDKDRSWMND